MSNALIETAIAKISGLSLQYMLICTEDEYAVDPRFKQVYSLLVISTEDGVDSGSRFVYDISRCRARAEEIARLLCNNSVTPCTVLDILDDIL